MMTPDKKGVFCDLCGAEYYNKFDYYSAKIDKVVVDKDRSQAGVAEVDRQYMDLDICCKCWDKMVDNVKKVIANRASSPKKSDGKNGGWRIVGRTT